MQSEALSLVWMIMIDKCPSGRRQADPLVGALAQRRQSLFLSMKRVTQYPIFSTINRNLTLDVAPIP